MSVEFDKLLKVFRDYDAWELRAFGDLRTENVEVSRFPNGGMKTVFIMGHGYQRCDFTRLEWYRLERHVRKIIARCTALRGEGRRAHLLARINEL